MSEKLFPTPGAVSACSVVPGTWAGMFGLGQHRMACHLVRVTWLLLGREQPSQRLEETPGWAEEVWDPCVNAPEFIPSWDWSLPAGGWQSWPCPSLKKLLFYHLCLVFCYKKCN